MLPSRTRRLVTAIAALLGASCASPPREQREGFETVAFTTSEGTGLSFDLSVQGTGMIGIEQADVDQLKISIGGTGTVALAGKAGKMNASVRGLSSLDASRLSTKDARIGAEGPATVKANVSNDATITASGVAEIELASGYAAEGMTAYVDLQEREFAAESRGYTATKHQREVGTGYFDMVSTAINPNSSTTAYKGSTEDEQFH